MSHMHYWHRVLVVGRHSYQAAGKTRRLTPFSLQQSNANNDCPIEELVAVLLKVTHGKDVSKTSKNVLPFSTQ